MSHEIQFNEDLFRKIFRKLPGKHSCEKGDWKVPSDNVWKSIEKTLKSLQKQDRPPFPKTGK